MRSFKISYHCVSDESTTSTLEVPSRYEVSNGGGYPYNASYGVILLEECLDVLYHHLKKIGETQMNKYFIKMREVMEFFCNLLELTL